MQHAPGLRQLGFQPGLSDIEGKGKREMRHKRLSGSHLERVECTRKTESSAQKIVLVSPWNFGDFGKPRKEAVPSQILGELYTAHPLSWEVPVNVPLRTKWGHEQYRPIVRP